MSKKKRKILDTINSTMLAAADQAVQVSVSTLKDLLEDAAKSDETLLYVADQKLASMLFDRIGNADVAVEEKPYIGEEVFYLVVMREPSERIEDIDVFRCVAAKGIWL